MLKIRRPLGRLIFNMGIAIPGKTVFLIETSPRSFDIWISSFTLIQDFAYYDSMLNLYICMHIKYLFAYYKRVKKYTEKTMSISHVFQLPFKYYLKIIVDHFQLIKHSYICVYFCSIVNIWNAKCAQVRAFIFNLWMEVLVKVPKF